jgi:carbon monoxide dehydrogenase subunit G
MQFSNSFEVSLPPAEAWATLMDIPRIAPCMPGAELVKVVDGKTYQGKVSVRMGPVLLSFAGTAVIEERDDVAHAARVKAQGNDSKGRGAANAVVRFNIAPSPNGSKVSIDTDLNLTGAVAQYGRGAGVIQSIAAQLIGQFSKNLEKQIAESRPALIEPKPDSVPDVLAAASALPPQPPAKPIGGFSLVFGALWANLAALFGKRGSSQ